MSIKIPIETSARHLHISQEDFEKLFGPYGDIEIPKGVIVAKRHIHMTPDEALALHVKDNDEVFVLTKSYGRALIYADVVVRVHRSYHLAMHVDTDEANAFNSDTEPYGVIVKFFDSNFNTDKWIEDELSGIRRQEIVIKNGFMISLL